jgi:hypothetical protein
MLMIFDKSLVKLFFETATVGENPTAIFQFIRTKVYVQNLQDLK